MYALLIAIHVLFAVIWVGGMVFAWAFQRPAASGQLEAPARLRLWVATFRGFFPWVWAAIILMPLTGYIMLFSRWDGFGGAPVYVHIMNTLGIVMILLFLHVFFGPFAKLKRAVAGEDWQEGGRQLGRIRRTVATNFAIGLVLIAVATGGRFLAALG